jgi:hypothetical protein
MITDPITQSTPEVRLEPAGRFRRRGTLLRRLWGRARGSEHGSEAGITLIEVLVSALIVALVGASVSQALIGGLDASSDQKLRSQAAQLAQQDQARLNGMSSLQLNSLSSTPRTVSLDGHTFSVTSTATPENSSGSSSCSTSGAGTSAYYKAVSSVTWSGNREVPVELDSLITPAAGGMLLTQVDNQLGNGLSGITVTATDTGTDYGSGTTGSGGCTVFSDLDSGNYTMTASATGYVDPNGNSTPPGLNSTVTSTGVSVPSTNPIYMGQAGTISTKFSTVDNNSGGSAATDPTAQYADVLSYYGSGNSLNMSATQTTGTAGTLATALPSSGTLSLFPFYNATTANYNNNSQIWAGKCQQMEPPSSVMSSGIDAATITPGSSGTQTIQEPALAVIVKTSSGVRTTPTDVKLSYASTSGTSCTDSWYATVGSNPNGSPTTSSDGVLAYPGQPFASTATSGSTESASGQTGSYTVCADLKSGSNYYYATTTGVQNTSYTGVNSATVTLSSTTGSTKC